MAQPHLLFVTGKLAEPALRRMLADLGPRAGFDYTVAVLPICVAALVRTPWIANHLKLPDGIDRIMLPGLCAGDLNELSRPCKVTVDRGHKDLLDLPEFFGEKQSRGSDYGSYDISILAEINHVPRLTLAEILSSARTYRDSGADIIDLGCDPGDDWGQAAETVKALQSEGIRVSIDSFNPREVEYAVGAGAELVLSVNSSNCNHASFWG